MVNIALPKFIPRITLQSKYMIMLLILIAIFYTLWVSMVIIGVYFLGLGFNWAGLSMDLWIISGIVLISLFIIFLLIVHVLPPVIAKQKNKKKKTKPEFYQGKRIYNITFPLDAKGGIFSRTYISIDAKNIVNFRYQMIPPDDLWPEQSL